MVHCTKPAFAFKRFRLDPINCVLRGRGSKAIPSGTSSMDQLRHRFRNFFAGCSAFVSESILRGVNIHSGDLTVLEQAFSETVFRKESHVNGKCVRDMLNFPRMR